MPRFYPQPHPPRVYNQRHGDVPPDAVYVGRPSKWGNCFVINREARRASVIAKYEAWLLDCPALLAAVRTELRGRDLVCWCAPAPCHADVLLRIANAPEEDSGTKEKD